MARDSNSFPRSGSRPGRRRRLNADDEVGQRRLDQDPIGETHRGLDDDRRDDVRQCGPRGCRCAVDEGADFHSFTYAKYGRAVLEQPGQFAWQVFDAKVLHLLRPEYSIARVTKARAQTLEELAAKLEDVNPEGFLRTVRAFNAAVRAEVPFDPYTRDGRGTVGLEPAKSNWANAIDQPPFEAYATTCGITFTFGGLRVDADAQVLDHDAAKIAGLYAAGEMVGGIFYFNYPSGAGLVSGAVFGRLAGASAARRPDGI